MAYRLPAERARITVEDGPTAEVEPIGSWPIFRTAVGLFSAYLAVSEPAAELTALQRLYLFFVTEGQPTWEIIDHRGPVLPTVEGMLRLPLPVATALIEGWTDTYQRAPAATAVDALVPAGPLRDELNAGLARSAWKH